MSTESQIPALSYWSTDELDQAVRDSVLFILPSHMGGSFYARLNTYDLHTGIGSFVIDHEQAGDFHGKTALEGLRNVTRVSGAVPAFLSHATRIAAQNDAFRTSLGKNPLIPGQVMFTHGINDRGSRFGCQTLKAVQAFDVFTEDNDPHRHRDFGVIEIEGEKVFWKMDLYDADLQCGSPDPANPAVTRRVLTVMLASEY